VRFTFAGVVPRHPHTLNPTLDKSQEEVSKQDLCTSAGKVADFLARPNMTNFKDPNVLNNDFNFFNQFTACLNGIYMWDFLTTLWFEWEFLTGKRKFKWTLLLYSASRIGAVGAVISSLVGFSATSRIDCQV